MRKPYEELVERIRGEASDLNRLVKRALLAWNQCKKLSSEQGVYIDSVALNLHGFYSGLERIFELLPGMLTRTFRPVICGTEIFSSKCHTNRKMCVLP